MPLFTYAPRHARHGLLDRGLASCSLGESRAGTAPVSAPGHATIRLAASRRAKDLALCHMNDSKASDDHEGGGPMLVA